MTLRRAKYLFPGLLIWSLLCAGLAQAQVRILPVTLEWQKTSEWCWAASGQMIMNFLGPTYVPQSYEANEAFSRTDCTSCPTPDACVSPGWPQFSTWGFNSNTTSWSTALTWNQVLGQINAGKPFMFSWEWNGGGAHAMVATRILDLQFSGLHLGLGVCR